MTYGDLEPSADFSPEKPELTPAEYEALGRAALTFLNGSLTDPDLQPESVINTAVSQVQGGVSYQALEKIHDVFHDVVVPLKEMRGQSDHTENA